MPSRRKLKKEIKKKTNLLIEDAFIESINGDAKEVEKMDKIVDEIIDERFELLSGVSNYPKNESRTKKKDHFKSIKENLEKKTADYSKKIGSVS